MDYIHDLRKDIGHKKIILNCGGCLVVKDDKILFQKRADNGKWGLPGGLLELDETYEEAAIRELKEETGLDVKLIAFLGIFHNYEMVWGNGDIGHTIGAYYLAEVEGGELRIDEESADLRFFSKDEIPELFADDAKAAVKAYLDGVRYPLLQENRKERG